MSVIKGYPNVIPVDAVKYTCVTSMIQVSVVPVYLDDNSSPSDSYYIWTYSVSIKNYSPKTVQLLRRHWYVIDCQGNSTEVKGNGVVGEQPIVKPDGQFEYTSGTYLYAPSGVMYGQYELTEEESGSTFYVNIPMFSLDSPYDKIKLH